MAKRLDNIPNHDRFGVIPYNDPGDRKDAVLGICPCGCREQIEDGQTYIEWDDRYYVDRSHLVQYLKKFEGLREVS